MPSTLILLIQMKFLVLFLPRALTALNPDPPYPNEAWRVPRVHHSPACLHTNGWHDMAAALTHKGVHHTWQGCPSSGGWSHAVSSDFVHWEDLGIDVKTLNETYAGMESVESPCSGFVALNDEGVPCAGFRQCASTHGITDHNPDAQDWDVPLEIRCATNADLTTWSEPKYIFDQYYYRGLPYDPARPWKDTDDKWYMAMSVDGCNSTTKAVPCAAGGQLDLWTADNFEGPWRQLDTPLFTTNKPKKGYDDANPIFYEVSPFLILIYYFFLLFHSNSPPPPHPHLPTPNSSLRVVTSGGWQATRTPGPRVLSLKIMVVRIFG